MSASVANDLSDREMIEFSEDEQLTFFFNIDQVLYSMTLRFIVKFQEFYKIMVLLHNHFKFVASFPISL